MRKTLIATAIAAAILPSLALAQTAAPSPLTGNMSLTTDYLFRGISQTGGKAALQGGFDYAHASGFYAGVWGSNISWLADTGAASSSSLELDVYGGYKGAISGDLGFDVGLATANYPLRNLAAGFLKPDTQELYGALTYKMLTLKYSQTLGALFGWNKTGSMDKTTGSGYLELNAAFDLGDGWGVSAHAGHQKVKGRSSASYSDYKIGVTKDIGFGVVGLAATTTNAKDSCSAVEDYCWGGYSAGKSTAVLSFAKSF
jgi:uncharacterized protein (TIGR02001 family)